jgi:ornithine decarboxylase
LLKATRKHASKLGVCFHVGSQCMHPDAYRIAIRMAYQAVRAANVPVEALDVGGGFPSIYPGMMPPPLTEFFSAIEEEFHKGATNGMELYAEPGRALVAESGSVLVRVELRKQDYLYINDGTYGSLFDAGTPQFIFPTALMRDEHSSNVMPYSFFGPTCDTLDFMKGPFYLSDDIAEGDYIEIGQLGAYSRAMMTRFNGFGPTQHVVTVASAPLMSVYQGNQIDQDMRLMAA